MEKILSEYKKKKAGIRKRLGEFKKVYSSGKRDIFPELCFCIFTPQSKAVFCDKAVTDLKKSNLLFKGSSDAVRNKLRGLVRFHNKKASYMVAARKIFKKGWEEHIKAHLERGDTVGAREWLVTNIKGLGYKEASHFLRNIGFGRNLAILDVHILDNLKKLGVIKEIPHSITRKNYIAIEEKMRKFAEDVKIPLEELDLLFWSNETGFVFK